MTDAVNAGDGLLCLMTFVARNRRVELQAFGRTARGGKPGSIQYAFSTIPECLFNTMAEDFRNLRAKKESIRLQQLIEYDVQEVQL